jgi:quercetin dioxygenase-like cupin family protein
VVKRSLFWQKWLFIVGLTISIFGLVMAFLSGTPFFDLFNEQIDPVFWGSKPVVESIQEFQQWVYGVLGATVTGWGIFLTFIAYHPFRRRKRWARDCVGVGLLIWFCVDTFISLYFRVYFNAAFNTLLFVLGILPLIFTWRYFAPERDENEMTLDGLALGRSEVGKVFDAASLEWQPVRPDVATGVFGKTLLANGLKVVLTRVEPGGRFSAHRDDYGHLFYFLSGQGLVSVGGKEFEARPGLTVKVTKGEDHAYENTGTEELMLISVNISGERQI